ncbi:MAG: xanthine dehydrogenase family protein molybdopterin-binding subunit [Chloroflexota bacterium]
MHRRTIGQPIRRPDAPPKVTGQTLYPADLNIDGQLYTRVLWSDRPHARLSGVQTGEALALPGVVAVFTAADVPVNEFGIEEMDEHVLAEGKVRFVGQPVALIVAESEESALVALDRIRVDYEALPGIFDPRQAMQDGAPRVHDDKDSNLIGHWFVRRGDLAAAFAACDVIVEADYALPHVEHAFLQPEAGLGYVDDQGRITVHTTGQWAHDDRHQIAHALGLPDEQVRVIYTPAGGAFGGREDVSVQILLALATYRLRRPVKMVWTRGESFKGHHKRHPFYMHYRTGATRDGRLLAMEARLIADGGACASTSRAVVKSAVTNASGPYHVPALRVDGWAVYTHNMDAGAMRGFGTLQVTFASEMQMAKLAEALGMDPVELRRRNILREGDTGPTNVTLPPGVGLEAAIDAAVEAGGWPVIRERSDRSGALRRGVGFACGWKNVGYSLGFPEQSTAEAGLYGGTEIERAVIKTGVAEVGQGVLTVMAQIAADTLGVPFERVMVINDDTAVVPDAGSSSASRQTLVTGRAVHEACLAALKQWHDEERPAVARYQFLPPRTTPFDPQTGECDPHFAYAYGAHIAEVEVDVETGVVRLVRVIAAHDVGRLINRLAAEGQVEGGISMGQGYALMEEFIQQDGYILTGNLHDYLVPTILDAPQEIVSIFVEVADSLGPWGAKGLGEMPTLILPPAIAAAIHDAAGVWLDRLPITPERLVRALG